MSHEEPGLLPLDVRARLAMLAAAVEEWSTSSDGEAIRAEELRRVIAGFDVPPAKHVPRVQADKAGRERE